RGPLREKLCRSTARRDHYAAGHDRHGVETFLGARSGLDNIAAARRAMYLIAVMPVWAVTAAVCLALWPSWENAGHLAALALFAVILTDVCLLRFRKIPFTCSWLPGKSRIHMAFLAALGLLLGGKDAAELERS